MKWKIWFLRWLRNCNLQKPIAQAWIHWGVICQPSIRALGQELLGKTWSGGCYLRAPRKWNIFCHPVWISSFFKNTFQMRILQGVFFYFLRTSKISLLKSTRSIQKPISGTNLNRLCITKNPYSLPYLWLGRVHSSESIQAKSLKQSDLWVCDKILLFSWCQLITFKSKLWSQTY